MKISDCPIDEIFLMLGAGERSWAQDAKVQEALWRELERRQPTNVQLVRFLLREINSICNPELKEKRKEFTKMMNQKRNGVHG